MLVLSRKVGQRIMIGDNITVVVQRLAGGRVSLAIDAPREISVVRGELKPFGVAPEPAANDAFGDTFQSVTKQSALL